MNALQKKLGPLKLWHWIAIGVALGAGILILKKGEGEGDAEPTGELFGGTGTGAFGPIDPETGIPYAFSNPGANGTPTGETLDQFLERVGMLKESGMLGPEVEPGEPETYVERVVEGGQQNQAAKSANAKAKRTGGRRPTSAGGAAAVGGKAHTTAPHPAQRVKVGISGAVGLTGRGAGTKHGGGKKATIKVPRTRAKKPPRAKVHKEPKPKVRRRR